MRIARRAGKAVEVVRLTAEGTRIARGHRFRKRLIKAERPWVGFWLFTFSDKAVHGLGMQERHRMAMDAWRLLRARMWEAGHRFKFCLALEWTENLVPHMHILIDRLIPKAVMSKHWQAVGGGSFMRASLVKGGHSGRKQAINYICKYLTKFKVHVPGCRRWAISNGILEPIVKGIVEWFRVTTSDVLALNLDNDLHVDNGDGMWAYFPVGWVERME